MTHNVLNRGAAALVLVVSMVTYAVTMAPAVVFWDVGEFIAAAYMLQVPHPPGSPLFLLVTRIAMMIPFAEDLAVRAHAFSALCSALAVMFTYLVTSRLIILFRGVPQTVADKITVYGASIIGALSLAFSTSYWDNAVEAEVYGVSMLFLTAIMWLVMRWNERADREGNEKYILFIAYLIGLSLGVHLLALLTIFPVLMIVYFRRYEVSRNSFIVFMLVVVTTFWVVYPGIVKVLPGMMDGDFMGERSEVFAILPWLLIAAAMYGVYWSYRHRHKMVHIALLSIVLIFVGYTTYTTVLIRSNANPPMNENDPSNLARLTSYLGREQYGNAPTFFPRRYSQEPQHRRIYTDYTSDMDFLIRYQLSHMFIRYLGWNFIGQESDYQDSGISWKETGGIPFLVGLLGLFYHFGRDKKMWLVLVSAFIILGPILALYQNQQEPQPRERDYFYVGAFYIFAIWIAFGVVGMVDWLKQWWASGQPSAALSFAVAGAMALAIPVNLGRVNWESHDRTGNYVAWDYSYNLLQTCEPDAILFTNGDNDTFPLWYLQDVEGIRRDVRIVNLSLINTNWYVQQMKNKPYFKEAKPVPISLTDQQIARIQPIQWETRQMDLPVTQEAIERYGVTDQEMLNNRKITFTMRNTLEFGRVKAIRVQDRLVQDIIFTNQWKLPIYFAVTCSPDSKIGLDDYLWFHGMAWRLEPRRAGDPERALDPEILRANLMNEPEDYSRTPRYGYKFRGISDPDVYFNENATRLMTNYRSAFVRLALYYLNVAGDVEKSAATLDRMEELIPRSKIEMPWEVAADLANFYARLGREEKFEELAKAVEAVCWPLVERYNPAHYPSFYSNPFRALIDFGEYRQDHATLLDLYKRLALHYPNDPTVKQRISQLQVQVQARGDTAGGGTSRQ